MPRMDQCRYSSHLPGLDKLIYFGIIVSGRSRICSGEFRSSATRSMIPGGQYLPRAFDEIYTVGYDLPSPPSRSYFIFLSFRPLLYVISKATSIQNPFFFFFWYSNITHDTKIVCPFFFVVFLTVVGHILWQKIRSLIHEFVK